LTSERLEPVRGRKRGPSETRQTAALGGFLSARCAAFVIE